MVEGEGGGTLVGKKLRECAQKMILARNLLGQVEDRSWVSIRILVTQGTGNESSVDHAGVWCRNRDWDLEVDPTTYV